jgi:hypothetical protein
LVLLGETDSREAATVRPLLALLALVSVHGHAFAQQNPPPTAPVPAAQVNLADPAAEKPVDIAKAVSCATLSQQFGDTLVALTAPTAKQKLDENVGKAASGQAGAGKSACMAHDYDAGLDQLRQAIAQLGMKAIR